jgi:tetratricopeptide (TPR) repeat protein
VSTGRLAGLFCFSASLYAQFLAPPGIGVPGQPPARQAPGSYPWPLLTASGDRSLDDVFSPFAPNTRPIAAVVSLRELQHPVPDKVLRDAYQAQQLARANKTSKAIAKLEHAIRIYPQYRDAHLDLGVLYVRAGRTADAHAEFQKALDIGPPVSQIYFDLALISLFSKQYHEAESWARKALELDSSNRSAQKILEFVLSQDSKSN